MRRQQMVETSLVDGYNHPPSAHSQIFIEAGGVGCRVYTGVGYYQPDHVK